MGVCVLDPCPRCIMEPMPELDRAACVAGMREQREAMLGRVADAVHDARDGGIIAGSERPVFDLSAEFRRKAFEAGLPCGPMRRKPLFPPA